MVSEQKFCSYFRFCIIELRGLFFNCISYGGLLLQNLVYHFTGFSNVRVIALNFGCPISHFVNGLVDHYFGVRLAHDFIYLVALGAN